MIIGRANRHPDQTNSRQHTNDRQVVVKAKKHASSAEHFETADHPEQTNGQPEVFTGFGHWFDVDQLADADHHESNTKHHSNDHVQDVHTVSFCASYRAFCTLRSGHSGGVGPQV